MIFWRDWTCVTDPGSGSQAWFWADECLGLQGPDRWVYIPGAAAYYFKYPRDATLFRLRWCR